MKLNVKLRSLLQDLAKDRGAHPTLPVRAQRILDAEAAPATRAAPEKEAIASVEHHKKERRKAERNVSANERKVRTACVVRDHGCSVVDKEKFGPCRGPLHFDHQWGRGKAPTTVESCRMLCERHHLELKTDNKPSRAAWIVDFWQHATKHRYLAEAAKAERELAFENAQHGRTT